MKNNVLIKARYNINTVENKIFQLILYKMQKNSNSKDLKKCTIQHQEFKDIIKRTNNSTIKAINECLEELRKSCIEIETESKWLKYGFINGFTYDKKNQEFTIKADAEIYELLFNYLKGYTPVNLAIFFSFKGYYTQRLYELLRLWSNTKTVITYTVDEIKELLKLEDQYSDYCNFKRRVITPSIKELNEKAMLQIDFKENKIGKRVTSIDFIVTDNDKRKYFEGNKESNVIHQEQQKKTYGKNKGKELKFMNFEQREYDYNSLEKKLLGWED